MKAYSLNKNEEFFSNESKNLKIYFNQVFTTQVKTTFPSRHRIFAKKNF